MSSAVLTTEESPTAKSDDLLASSPTFSDLAGHLRLLRASTDEKQQALAKLSHAALHLDGVVGVSWFCRNTDGRFLADTPLICHRSVADIARSWEPQLIQAIGRLGPDRVLISMPLDDKRYGVVVASVGASARPEAAYCLFYDSDHCSQLCVEMAAQLIAYEMEHWLEINGKSIRAITLRLYSALIETLPDQTTARGFQQFAAHLERELGVSQVMLGTVLRGGTARLQAISGLKEFKRPTPFVSLVEEVMTEAILRNTIKAASRSEGHRLTKAERDLLQLCEAERIVSCPLRVEDEKPSGAWIVVDDGGGHWNSDIHTLPKCVLELMPTVAPAVRMLSAYRTGFMQFVRKSSQHYGSRTLLAATAALLLIGLVPIQYPVNCDSQLQPVTRRFVPAPFEGVLKEVLVRPGDVVQVGEVMARMDQQEMLWRLAAHQADYMSASKEHDTAMARRDTSAAQVARLEMDRLSLHIKMLQERIANLEIKSPIDGVVLSGDPRKLEGARLTLGQTLFETGPLDRMLVEILVPQDEVDHVKPGQMARIRFDAMPHRHFAAEIERVSPSAETRNQGSVFVAEVSLDNPNGTLRPGMEGRTRVATSRRPILWCLFHKPWTQLLRLLRI